MPNVQDKLNRDFDRIFDDFTRTFRVFQLDQNGRYSQRFDAEATLNFGGGIASDGVPFSSNTNYDAEIAVLTDNAITIRSADDGQRKTRIIDPQTNIEYSIKNQRRDENLQVLEVTVVPESSRVS